ncbi:MAG: 2-amino-4-hydroxy-6-hydroxymethyldihydropteridine diphosphokinase [Burkholderiaceae bacterium]
MLRAWPAPGCAWVGLGANLGDAQAALQRAVQALASLPGTRLVALSSLYRSAPVDAGGPDYWNAVAALHTALAPQPLLEALLAIEQTEGRLRPYRNAPRTLDLDLLLHGPERVRTPTLTLPHPRLHERAFVLQPLAELLPGGVAPQALAAVAAQRIERVPAQAVPSWPAQPWSQD